MARTPRMPPRAPIPSPQPSPTHTAAAGDWGPGRRRRRRGEGRSEGIVWCVPKVRNYQSCSTNKFTRRSMQHSCPKPVRLYLDNKSKCSSYVMLYVMIQKCRGRW